MPEDLAAEHRDAAWLAELAGQALLELRAAPTDARDIGAAGDRMAHHLIVSELGRLYPHDDVRSEEGLEHVSSQGRLWIVDPLDGTREFVARNGEFAVMIGLAEGGRAVLGVLVLPAIGRTFIGGEGIGAFEVAANGARTPIHVSSRTELAGARVVVSRSHRAADAEAKIAALGLVLDRRPAPEAFAANRALQKVLMAARSGSEQFDSLPGTRLEVQTLTQLFQANDRPTRTLLGTDASEPELDRLATAGELAQFAFIHLATHGVIDSDLPLSGGLVLAVGIAVARRPRNGAAPARGAP